LAVDVRCELLLFSTTTSEKEQLQAVAGELGIPFRRNTHELLGRYYALGKVGDFEVIAVRTEMGPLKYGGSASRGIFFKLSTPATAIVQLGMAFGIDPKRQNAGDVLVSSSLIPYDRRKVLAHERHYRYRRKVLVKEGHYRFDYADAKLQPARPSMLELFMKEAAKPDWPFRIHVGAVLSGGTASYCTKFRDELVGAFEPCAEPIVGGEMEAVGLISVSPPDDPAWIVVKGISDFAEDTRPEGWERTRDLACRNAAMFVLSALKKAKQP
jgi:nucleoside phosphorylase